MRNNLVLIILIVLIGVLSAFGLLWGISQAVQVASIPVVDRVDAVIAQQRYMERRINEINQKLSDVSALNTKLDQLQTRLAALPSGPGGNAPNRPMPPQEDFNKVYDIPVGSSVIVGKKNAPITITEFLDLQCPFCSRFHTPIKQVLKEYPDKVKLLVKNFPLGFHPNAKPAAKAALAANEQGKYIEMTELLLENGADVSEAKLQEHAKTLGINYDKLKADLKNKDAQYEKQISEDMALAQQIQVMGTPTFFLNGKKSMSRNYNAWKAEIDKILAGK